jgi:hypothetical protein
MKQTATDGCGVRFPLSWLGQALCCCAAYVASWQSQPWQLPRRTAGHGSKADTQPRWLPEREQRIAELEQEIERLQRTD